jgi:hypothetical protein
VNDWGDFIPEWIEQNRTGPGPLAPRYAEKGMAMGKWKGDSNPGGPGGRTRRIQTNRSGGGGGGKKNDCCPMVAAVRSVKQGKFRLARRYAVMSVRLLVARVA